VVKLAEAAAGGRPARGAAREPIAQFGDSPVTGKPVKVMEGRFGPYVTDGETNATLPKGTDPKDLTEEAALVLLAERAAKGPAKGKPKRKAAAPKAAAAKKPAAKKKAPAKKAAK
jgi:DNA topoisomerase I